MLVYTFTLTSLIEDDKFLGEEKIHEFLRYIEVRDQNIIDKKQNHSYDSIRWILCVCW